MVAVGVVLMGGVGVTPGGLFPESWANTTLNVVTASRVQTIINVSVLMCFSHALPRNLWKLFILLSLLVQIGYSGIGKNTDGLKKS
jgi:hypothetical protein